MSLEQIKYSTYAEDDTEGILIADIFEEEPMTDAAGNLQYYSLENQRIFSVDEDEDRK